MFTFQELSQSFAEKFAASHFPAAPVSLYGAADYFLALGGKRIRPVLCLMGNELFDNIHADAWHASTAIELFHNFTLIHDDIMDKASLRRGQATVHEKYGLPTALLSGDVMLVVAYDYLNKIKGSYLNKIIHIFNKTAKEVCEGQQMDMDFERQDQVGLKDYLRMIELKTSVLLAASLQMGALIGGAGQGNQQHLYEFGKNLGIAFQIQDDYLDAFGDPEKFGKEIGGDIKTNKKTFLMIRAFEVGSSEQKERLGALMQENSIEKVPRVLEIFKACEVDSWAKELQDQFTRKALQHLEDVAVVSSRKAPLQQLAEYLLNRQR